MEILWGSAELRNCKKIEELRKFQFAIGDLNDYDYQKKYHNQYDFYESDKENLDEEKFKGLSSKVELRSNMSSNFVGDRDWNWHQVLLDSSYDSDTNQVMTALFDN